MSAAHHTVKKKHTVYCKPSVNSGKWNFQKYIYAKLNKCSLLLSEFIPDVDHSYFDRLKKLGRPLLLKKANEEEELVNEEFEQVKHGSWKQEDQEG